MIRRLLLAAALVLGSFPAFAQNYQATQGSGTTFGSKLVSTVNYPQIVFCDPTTPSQCAAVDSSGYISIKIASGQVASGAYASGSFSSGAFASGSYASGAFAAGSMVDLLTIIGSKTGGTAAASSLLAGCVYNTSAPTLTNGQQAAVQCDVNGSPKVTVTNTNSNGQATMANSSPVVIASNQSTLAVSLASAQVASGAFASGSIASGAVASGAFASGALSSGSIASGAMVDFLTTVGSKNAGTAATNAQLGAGVYNSTPLTLANTQQASTQTDVSGYLKTRPSDGTKSAVIDPCEATLQTSAPISITTATTTRIVAPSASNKTYICALFLTSAAADNVGIVEGTGGTCGTGTVGVIGGTTAANGPNFAANGGVFLQAGGKVAVAQTAGTNVDLCLITSAATPLAGVIKYVQAP